jgi:hypothetical protein
MNVDNIYQTLRDDAFADQFEAKEYSVFVAMPFSNRGGYPEERIRDLLLRDVHLRANEILLKKNAKRVFAPLHRVDGVSGNAIIITEQIVTNILADHFFVADLTGANYGVVLETGIALALKPNKRIILVTQDDAATLHFDLKVTKETLINS